MIARLGICELAGYHIMSHWAAPVWAKEAGWHEHGGKPMQERHCITCNVVEYRTVQLT